MHEVSFVATTDFMADGMTRTRCILKLTSHPNQVLHTPKLHKICEVHRTKGKKDVMGAAAVPKMGAIWQQLEDDKPEQSKAEIRKEDIKSY